MSKHPPEDTAPRVDCDTCAMYGECVRWVDNDTLYEENPESLMVRGPGGIGIILRKTKRGTYRYD